LSVQAISTALTAIDYSDKKLSAISNNLANAEDVNYTKKHVRSEPAVAAGQPQGVTTRGPFRVVNDSLIKEMQNANSEVSYYQSVSEQLNGIQKYFGSVGGKNSMGANLSLLSQKFQNLANGPESANKRNEVIRAADEVIKVIQKLSQETQNQRGRADDQLNDAITFANSKLNQIADINEQVAYAQVTGRDADTLRDKRDTLVRELAHNIDINVNEDRSGKIHVQTKSGRALLQGGVVNELQYNPTTLIVATDAYPANINGIMHLGADITSDFSGGVVKGLLDFRDVEAINIQAELDELTVKLRDMVNTVHNKGSGFPPAHALTGTRNIQDPATATFGGVGTVRFAVTDADGNNVTHFDLDLSTVATAEAARAAIDAGLGADGTATWVTDLADPTLNKLQISATSANHGIAIGELPEDPGIPRPAVSVTNVEGILTNPLGFSHSFGLNDFFTTETRYTDDGNPDIRGITRLLKIRDDIKTTPELISRGFLDTNLPAPLAGEAMLRSGNGRNALAIQQLFSKATQFDPAGSLTAREETLQQYANNIVHTHSNRSKLITDRATTQQETLDATIEQFRGQSGVNSTEEIADMIMLFNLFQASTKTVETGNKMFDVLVNII